VVVRIRHVLGPPGQAIAEDPDGEKVLFLGHPGESLQVGSRYVVLRVNPTRSGSALTAAMPISAALPSEPVTL
jgi:hypothetical protein